MFVWVFILDSNISTYDYYKRGPEAHQYGVWTVSLASSPSFGQGRGGQLHYSTLYLKKTTTHLFVLCLTVTTHGKCFLSDSVGSCPGPDWQFKKK